MKYLFGPVPSRRLGVSLGVDIIPLKVCSFNCIYCEAGKTTELTIERKEYIPIQEVVAELKEYLDHQPELDFITFSGQGEPTLNSGLGAIIRFIKDHYPQYKVAVISNGSLFWQESVRNDVMKADVLMPSLNAISRHAFHYINRPSRHLNIDKILEGLIKLRKVFTGKIYVEIFLVPGLNTSEKEITLLKAQLKLIKADIIQLNTLDRPGIISSIKPLDGEGLETVQWLLAPLPVEIIAKAGTRKQIQSFNKDLEKQILDILKLRPCTDLELCEILNVHLNELNKYLSVLCEQDSIESEEQERGIFFKLKNNSQD